MAAPLADPALRADRQPAVVICHDSPSRTATADRGSHHQAGVDLVGTSSSAAITCVPVAASRRPVGSSARMSEAGGQRPAMPPAGPGR